MRISLSMVISAVLVLFISQLAYASYGAKLCARYENQFSCYKIKKGDSWKSLFKDPDQRDIVMRINRMNINPDRGTTIAIPKNFEANGLLDWGPFHSTITPPGEKVIIVSLSELAFGAYGADGKLEYWGPVSGARGYCPDIRRGCHTPKGHFAIYSKAGPGCVSTKYPVGKGGAPMPYCMFFHGGYALHGSYSVPGYNASHGCVRLFVDDAKWLNREFIVGEHEVPVIIRN